MPLFRNRSTASPATASSSAAANGTTTTKTHTTRTAEESPRRSGFFSRNRGGHSLMHSEDASITAARERVVAAEAAERDADRALMQARTSVKEAREHVRRLEKEAAEE